MVHTVAKHSGWTVRDDDPGPGDRIEFPPAIATSPRGPERFAWHDDYEVYADAEPSLRIKEISSDPRKSVGDAPACCGFCSPEGAIAERGVYHPDYKLVAPDGEVVVYTCHACIVDAPVVD